MWITREVTPTIIDAVKTFPVVVLIGPRQVGKTSVLEHTFPKYRYASLDVAAHAEMAETRPQDFLAQFPPPVILDEIQYAPSFFRHIKTSVDQHRADTGQFILTGSQNFVLMKSVADSLAGRAAIIPFLGLSGSEWNAAPELRERYSRREFLWRGGYPGLWSQMDQSPSRDRWYQGYVATYLERDVRNLLRVGNLRDFERFLRACAARCGQTLNMSELGRDVGVSATTAREWISVLQASNQITLLEPYYRSLGKRLAKSPKLYFTDTGLVSYLMGFQSCDSLWASPYAGALWENYVVTQWLRWRDWFNAAASLWYWRDQPGNEVDLVIEIDQQVIGVECKLSERPEARDARGLTKLREFYGESAVRGLYIACTAEQPFNVLPDVTAKSGWTVWKL
jgi:hypothetical protein